MTTHPDPDEAAPAGVIGARQLVAVQTFAVARLTSDPVALIPGTFIAVTGRGPKDSNESGKTSFLAATALLLGDPEWQTTGNGTANTASLLFEPVIAGASTQLVGAAERGYVAGVFAEPDGTRPHTVWLQISNDSPHIQVRHQAGVHLLTQGTDSERHDAAQSFYRRLGSEALGATEFAARLYGRSPKVLAYVASRGQMRSRPSLLKLEAGTYSPDRIGDALITLSGRAKVLELDKNQRKLLEDKRTEYATALKRHDRSLAKEEEILRQVAGRAALRTKVRRAEADHRASRARALLDATARVKSAKALLPDAEARLHESEEHIRHLREQRAAHSNLKELEQAHTRAQTHKNKRRDEWINAQRQENDLERETKKAGSDLDTARALGAAHGGEPSLLLTARHGHLTERKTAAEIDRSIAERDARRYTDQLKRAQQGHAGQVGEILALLHAADVTAVGLHDQIELDSSTRDTWEAALHPWRDAVCVPQTELPRALKALAERPGAVLVTSPATSAETDGHPTGHPALPPGVRSAPAPSHGFLAALARQSSWTDQPPHAQMGALGVHIVGAFPTPMVGRDALCVHLRARRAQALAAQGDADALVQRLITRITLVEAEIERALAAEKLPALYELHTSLTGRLAALRDAFPHLHALLEQAEGDWADAKAALDNRKQRIEALNAEIATADKTAKQLRGARDELAAASDDSDLETARAAFGKEEDTARTLLNWPPHWLPEQHTVLLSEAPQPQASPAPEPAAERRAAVQLRMEANSLIDSCLHLLELESHTAGYPTTTLARVVQHGFEDPEARSDAALRALADWLADTEAADADAQEDVQRVRGTRESENAFIASSVETLTEELRHTQDVIVQRVTGALDGIAAALDQLNRAAGGFGADLHYQVDPPSDTDHSWRCAVTPRWRRNPNGPLLSYGTVTNTAQEKLFSIHLVLAALLAAPNAPGRVLILDELGDSLGQEHRREVLAAITRVADTHGITVLGTCQDTLMRDVAPVCGQILYFHYPSKSDYLNLPTRMFGFDDQARRVGLTAAQLLSRIA
ncbi:hypothetical protein GCM10010495_69630 [Kitasatospora herbaricolor]|uniref:hypothetical protein n=1 Tax=Kitasatospora herbaricolor TaxID=68217 RepID=UPI00174EAED5|nr:hypothetical protein [Kitasatospora herbaricolor]MDQ0313322.1 hypothetical protein [Kitasatospora herbaricolor]GGV42050.1 hypothetical protein GCM10010495_69630 [Kitasatospora herbaricolor]